MIANVRRPISRPNGRKAAERLRAEIDALIDRAPSGTPVVNQTAVRVKAEVLFTLLDHIYRDLK